MCCWKKQPQQRPVSSSLFYLFVLFFFSSFHTTHINTTIWFVSSLIWNVDRILKQFVKCWNNENSSKSNEMVQRLVFCCYLFCVSNTESQYVLMRLTMSEYWDMRRECFWLLLASFPRVNPVFTVSQQN
jgi:hypothetical protein